MAYTPPPNPSPFNTPIEDVLFIDFETVPQLKTIHNLPDADRIKSTFAKRFQKDIGEYVSMDGALEPIAKAWRDKAALTAEFGKIACASVGIVVPAEDGGVMLRVKGYGSKNEKEILEAIAPLMGKKKALCAHNGKRFDYPIAGKRYLANGLRVPSLLRAPIEGLKPWEVLLFDTMEMWAFGDIRATSSLDAIAMTLGLPSPKADMTGADVAGLYYGPHETDLPWEEADALKKIVTYCNGDVVTLVNIYLLMIGRPAITPERIVFVD